MIKVITFLRDLMIWLEPFFAGSLLALLTFSGEPIFTILAGGALYLAHSLKHDKELELMEK